MEFLTALGSHQPLLQLARKFTAIRHRRRAVAQGVAFLGLALLLGRKAGLWNRYHPWNQSLVNAHLQFCACHLITNLERKALWCTLIHPALGKQEGGCRCE